MRVFVCVSALPTRNEDFLMKCLFIAYRKTRKFQCLHKSSLDANQLGHNKGKKDKTRRISTPQTQEQKKLYALDNLQEMETEKQNEVQYDEKETQP